jgi:hypothetical protein
VARAVEPIFIFSFDLGFSAASSLPSFRFVPFPSSSPFCTVPEPPGARSTGKKEQLAERMEEGKKKASPPLLLLPASPAAAPTPPPPLL